MIKDLNAGYGEKTIINNLNLNIKKGSICAILGRNGSGKTTLFRCINSYIKPKSGEIIVENKNVTKLTKQQIASLISLVPQKSTTVFSFSVLDMVLMGEAARLRCWETPKMEAKERAKIACEEVGIGHLIDRYYNQLSGGEQQLVLFARAIMQNTPIMLMDEPISHLDFSNQHKIMDILNKIVKKKGVTVVITLHDPNIAVNYCDDVAMIDKGCIISAGSMKELFTTNNLKKLYGKIIETDYTSRGLKVAVPSII